MGLTGRRWIMWRCCLRVWWIRGRGGGLLQFTQSYSEDGLRMEAAGMVAELSWYRVDFRVE